MQESVPLMENMMERELDYLLVKKLVLMMVNMMENLMEIWLDYL